MKTYLIFFLAFNFAKTSFGQIKNISCDCPKKYYSDIKEDTIFHFLNGKALVVCGYKNPDVPITFSEFVIAVCGHDTIIDFWDATLTCRLKFKKDTLCVEELQNLPIGKNFEYQEIVWTTEQIYFDEQNVIKKLFINKQIRKYNQAEIQSVLKEFERAKFGFDENKSVILNRLFIATISGNKIARKYFGEFEHKFGTLDGAYAEEYGDLREMLGVWDKKQ
jgi:hypothetical protein